MTESRTENAARNIFFGILLKAYQILMPFFMRTAMIYLMGVQYLGLNSLFRSILQVLNLAELGVGSAMVFSMYKPIAEHDSSRICALLRLYKLYYRVIGIVIAIIGLLLTPFVPRLISGDIPNGMNITVLYLLNLAATVLSYWLFAYKNSLLQAHQRVDMVSKVTLITTTVQFILQIGVLWFFHDYYLYVIVALGTQALTNIIIAIVATNMYPEYQPIGDLSKEEKRKINNKIKDLFTAKFGSIVVGSVDTIVISAYLGLTKLAVYQNYYFILESVYGVILVIFNSIMAGVGNSLVTESMEKNYSDLKKFTFMSCWLITICTCCFAVMYQPFMKVWVGSELMLEYSFVITFCVYFYVMSLAMVWATIKDAAGMWHQDRFRPLVGATTNLVLNLILVRIIGLYGILLSTVISYLLVSMPWLIYNIFSQVYLRSSKNYVRKILLYAAVCIFATSISALICNNLKIAGVFSIITNAVIALIISNIIQIVAYCKTVEFNASKDLLLSIMKWRKRKNDPTK